jgi:hypothetical protein
MSPFDKTRTYAVTASTSTSTAAENGSKVRKKPLPADVDSIRKAAPLEVVESGRKRTPEVDPAGSGPSAPSSELFELLCRLQSSRLDDQVTIL